MSWLNINGNWIGRHSGKSWSSYWAKHLFGEDDLNLRAGERSGLTITDSIGDKDISILPATITKSTTSSQYINTGILPVDNTVWVVLGRFPALDFQYKIQGTKEGTSGYYGFGIYASPAYKYWFEYGNSWNNSTTQAADTDWHVFILHAGKFWVMPPTTLLTDSYILNVIATETPAKTLTYSWVEITVPIQYGGQDLTGDGPKFEYAASYIGTITDNVITWQAKHIFNNEYCVIDLLGIANPIWTKAGVPLVKKTGGTYGFLQAIDVGYTKYSYDGRLDIQVPYGLDGNPLDTAALPNGYVKYFDVPAVADGYNLADAILNIPGDDWDRSDTEIWKDEARAATTFYDATNPNRWHISELNNLILKNWAESGHEGKCFVKMTPGSVDIETRNGLTEILGYTTNINLQADRDKVHQFCGDYDILQTPYLLNPYNEVLKVMALEDTECKFNLNNSIIYSKNELWAKIDNAIKYADDEDALTAIINYLIPHTNPIGTYFTLKQEVANILFNFNSFPDGHCGPTALQLHNVLEHYYPGEDAIYTADAHTSNRQNSFYVELYSWLMVYKDKYAHASFDEVLADEKLFTEPIRKTGYNYDYYTQSFLDLLKTLSENATWDIITAVDNLSMKLPSASYFEFPVKSTNVPSFYTTMGSGMNTKYANAIVTIPIGVVGEISMPFNLLLISGTGKVIVDGDEYTLPAEEATVKALVQDDTRGVKWINSFTVTENTGGITAEFLVNRARIRLYHDNVISKGIISGDIKIEAVATETPVEYSVVGIDKGESDSWSLYFDRWLTTNKSIKVPLFGSADINFVNVSFNKSSGSKPRPIGFINNTTVAKSISAGTPVIDKCWAAKLMPRDDSFSDSLELSFTAIDDSNIYYTTDESTPDATKTQYTEPFTISATTTVKWINIKEGYADSHVNTRVITKS